MLKYKMFIPVNLQFEKCSLIVYILVPPFFPRHVKGIVLVALADGTLAIFHRGVGKHPIGS